MDFYRVKTCRLRTLGCLAVFLYDPQDFLLFQRTGNLSACL